MSFTIPNRGSQTNTVSDFVVGTDVIDVSVFNVGDFATLSEYLSQSGSNVLLQTFFNDINGDTPNEVLILENVSFNDLSAADFVFNTSLDPVVQTATGTNGVSFTNNDFVLFGGNGNDQLTGSGGDDELNGGAGNDILNGVTGVNLIRTGEGADTVLVNGRGSRTNVVEDFVVGTDRIDVRVLNVSDLETLLPYISQDNDDVVIQTFFNDINGSTPNETIRLEDVNLNDLTAADFVFNNINADLEITATNSNDFVLFGGLADDELTGFGGDDELNGGTGDDILIGGFGVNLLRGGDGADEFRVVNRGSQTQNVVDFEDGIDTIDVRGLSASDFDSLIPYLRQDGDDVRLETFFNDTNGSSPNEVVIIRNTLLSDLSAADFRFNDVNGNQERSVTNSNDFVLFGGVADDVLTTSGGDDQLIGGTGDDELNAGAANDILRGGDGADELNGGTGFDIASYVTASTRVIVDLEAGTATGDQADGDVFDSIEGVEGGDFNDIITGRSDSAGRFIGNAGNDRITALGETDNGNGTDNVIFGGAGNDFIISGAGRDEISGGDGNDIIDGGDGVDEITAGAGNDRITTDTSFDDDVDGGDGVDTLVTGVFRFIDIEANGDIRFSGDGSFFDSGDYTNIEFFEVLGNTFDVSEGVIEADGQQTFLTTGNNIALASFGDTSVFGLDGSDYIVSNGAAHSLVGGNGSDFLIGNGGNDRLDGGNQNDFLDGGTGNDILLGGQGVDTLFGGEGDDLVLGGNRNDEVHGDAGNDRVFGGNGSDEVFGEDGNDILRGGAVDDLLDGGAGDDAIFGGTGIDTILGGAGNDSIDGRGGFDTINGGAGNDSLTGGFNADIFVFEDGFGVDIITDFASTSNAERIDLSAVLEFTDFADLSANHLTQSGSDVIIDDGLGNSITLTGVDISDLDAIDFVF